MSRLQAKVTIAAPPERVWAAVLEDLDEMPKWAAYLRSVSVVDGGRPGPGHALRYELNLPGDWSLVLRPAVWDRPRHCAGSFADSPVTGSWSYDFAAAGDGTDLSYDMDFKLGGMLRFAGGLLQSRYEQGIRDAMEQLKEYLERS
ncbi:MAG: SRPBCC family protein [Candidatus Dormiibacterota bacterium]